VPLYLRIDVLAGALVCVAAATIWVQGAALDVGDLRYFGPGFLPRILAVALMGGGLALLAAGLLQPDSAATRLVLAFKGPLMVGLGIFTFAVTIRGFALGPIAVPQLGLLIAGPLAVLITGMGSAEGKPRELLVLGPGLSALLVLVFVEFLNMQVPVFPAIVAENLPLAWGPDWPRRAAILLYAVVTFGLWRLFGLTLTGLKPSGAEDAKS
jgi:hypothetical protein